MLKVEKQNGKCVSTNEEKAITGWEGTLGLYPLDPSTTQGTKSILTNNNHI